MPRVSRRHAVIQAQVSDEYWLGDSGSRNGTYVNAKRIAKPTPAATRRRHPKMCLFT